MISCHDGFNFSAKLMGTFNEVYQRSNKSSGRKNLRCFPRCSGGVHKPSSFCGDAIEAQILYSLPISAVQSDVDIDQLIVLGEFASIGSTTDLNSVSLGDFTSLKKIEEKIKHDAWFRSAVVENEAVTTHRDNIIDGSVVSATIVFNAEKSWHYGWTSNRHSRECHHTFKIFALAPLRNTGGTAFKCVGMYADGPKFRLNSTRRSTSVSPPPTDEGPPKRGREEAVVVPYDGGIGIDVKRQKMSTGASTSTPSPPLEIGTAVLGAPPTTTDNCCPPPIPPRLAVGMLSEGTLSRLDYLLNGPGASSSSTSIEPPITSTPSLPSSPSSIAIPPQSSRSSSPLKQEIVVASTAAAAAAVVVRSSTPPADKNPSGFPPVPPRLVVGVLSFDSDDKLSILNYLTSPGVSSSSDSPPSTSEEASKKAPDVGDGKAQQVVPWWWRENTAAIAPSSPGGQEGVGNVSPSTSSCSSSSLWDSSSCDEDGEVHDGSREWSGGVGWDLAAGSGDAGGGALW